MRLKKPECAHCGSARKIKLYWSTNNLLKKPMKTYHCDHCAKLLMLGDFIKAGKQPEGAA